MGTMRAIQIIVGAIQTILVILGKKFTVFI